jgi:hypothetical protein
MKDRRAYFNWYNRNRRGRPEPKHRVRYRCMMCGNLTYKRCLDRLNRLEVMKQYGFTYSFVDPDNPTEVQLLLDYQKFIADKTLNFLDAFIKRGVLDKEYVAMYLGLGDVQVLQGIKGGYAPSVRFGNAPSSLSYKPKARTESKARVVAWAR